MLLRKPQLLSWLKILKAKPLPIELGLTYPGKGVQLVLVVQLVGHL
jgi:hypothetical protein